MRHNSEHLDNTVTGRQKPFSHINPSKARLHCNDDCICIISMLDVQVQGLHYQEKIKTLTSHEPLVLVEHLTAVFLGRGGNVFGESFTD